MIVFLFTTKLHIVIDRNGGGSRKPSVLAWLRLVRVFDKTERAAAEHLRGWGLSMGQFDILAHVGAMEGLSQRDLADSLLVTKGNVTQLLEKMEGRGLISRRSEGRIKRLFLTEEGRRLFEEVVPAHESFIAERFSVLSGEEQGRFHALLRELDRKLK